ncbi:MAG: riboflavin kinase/FMN adenylyltransferase [Actinomycetia bacterium]|nr:riboflavin kinase/FMN adenylyltransferase [Actinomycetes bacterium]
MDREPPAAGQTEPVKLLRETGDTASPESGTVVTIGAYDGVHRGHQALLRLVRELASARDLDAAVVTFDRHPAQVVRPDSAPKLLTSLDQKLDLLEGTGDVDVCALLHFDRARSQEPAEDFVRNVLVKLLDARIVVVGADFHFGYKRSGNVAMLEAAGSALGFEVIGLGLVAAGGHDHEPISSTRVRSCLADSDVEAAAALLGRPHEVQGTGGGAGSVLVPAEICLPAEGRYLGELLGPDGMRHRAEITVAEISPAAVPGADPSRLELVVPAERADFDEQPVSVRFVDRA